MSLVNMPSIRSYGSKELKFGQIKNVMPVNAFEKICQFLHFNNNEEFIAPGNDGHDRLHGQGNRQERDPAPNLGITSNIVLRLANKVPNGQNY